MAVTGGAQAGGPRQLGRGGCRRCPRHVQAAAARAQWQDELTVRRGAGLTDSLIVGQVDNWQWRLS